MPKEIKIYIESSVIGGYFDDEFKIPTRKLFALFKQDVYKPIISSHVMAELNNGAPEEVKEILKTINYEEIEVTAEMYALSSKYMEEKIVGKNYRADALHIAIATVLGVDVLVSWNFRHIVNFDKIRLFNAVNMKERYNMLEIRTPQEVLRDDN